MRVRVRVAPALPMVATRCAGGTRAQTATLSTKRKAVGFSAASGRSSGSALADATARGTRAPPRSTTAATADRGANLTDPASGATPNDGCCAFQSGDTYAEAPLTASKASMLQARGGHVARADGRFAEQA